MKKDVYEKRILGRTRLGVNPVGLGGIPIQRIDIDTASMVINKAIDFGLNFIDSARGYTCSEEYIGYALKGRRCKVYLATKSMARTYEGMKKDIEISLNNFNTSYIDLYQCHNVKTIEELKTILDDDGAYKALNEAKLAGRIHHIGITSHNKDFLKWLLNSEYIDLFETIQFPYNFLEDDAIEIFEEAHKMNIGTIAMKPLGGGTIDKGVVALKYLLQDDNLSIAIPGMGSLEEVVNNLTIQSLDINDQDQRYINELKDELKNDFCHRCGYCLPCTKGIDIPTMFTLERYYTKYNLQEWATSRYFGSKVLASSCIDCKKCITRCPYSLDIPTKLKRIVQMFEKWIVEEK